MKIWIFAIFQMYQFRFRCSTIFLKKMAEMENNRKGKKIKTEKGEKEERKWQRGKKGDREG